jgi:hypothetical protein
MTLSFFLKVQRWEVYLFIYIYFWETIGQNPLHGKEHGKKKINPHKLLKDRLLNQRQNKLKFSFSFKLSFKQNGDEIVVYFKIFLV